MFYIYLLKSVNREWYYVGMSEDVDKRLSQHNALKTRSTKAYVHFVCVWRKSFRSRIIARDYENF